MLMIVDVKLDSFLFCMQKPEISLAISVTVVSLLFESRAITINFSVSEKNFKEKSENVLCSL